MNEYKIKNQTDILSQINSELEIEEYMKKNESSDFYDKFSDYFWNLSKVNSLSDSNLIKLSGIEKSYYYQIKKGKRNPGRDKILRLCIGAGLTIQETTHALEMSECAILYSRNRRDIILSVAINRNLTVIDTNLLLDKYKEKPLQ